MSVLCDAKRALYGIGPTAPLIVSNRDRLLRNVNFITAS